MFRKQREHNKKEDGRIRLADICIMAFFLLLALGSFVLLPVGKEAGHNLQISYDGKLVADVSLIPNTVKEDDGEIRYCLLLYQKEDVLYKWYETKPDLSSLVSEVDGYNLLAVSGERVWMEAASCKDQLCVHHRPIAGGGEIIICLPHKLAAEIVGGESDGPDGMVN